MFHVTDMNKRKKKKEEAIVEPIPIVIPDPLPPEECGFALKKWMGQMPTEGLLELGNQHDTQRPFALAVADTPFGMIPGKAKGDQCWYSFCGEEHTTCEFSYVLADEELVKLVKNTGNGGPPPGAMQTGFQVDGTGKQYAAIANTRFGTIPGKARDNNCWYSYKGREHTTWDFKWVVAEIKKDEPPPPVDMGPKIDFFTAEQIL